MNNIKNPENGRNLGIKAYRKEEVYSGECILNAPDIVIDNQTIYQLSFKFMDKVFGVFSAFYYFWVIVKMLPNLRYPFNYCQI